MTVDSAFCERPLVVLPTYNECENIESMARSVLSYLPQATVWIVDDNSPDGTGQIADALAAVEPRIEVIHRPGKMGLGRAYVDAYQRALARDFDCLIQMDADFSHDPAYLPSLLAGLADADLVLGSRYVPGGGTRNWAKARQIISQGGNVVARIGLGIQVHDATGGFRAFRRSTIERLRFQDLDLRGYGFQIEVINQIEKAGMTIREIPIIFVERAAGKSKMSKDIALEAFLYIVRRRLDRMLHRDTSDADRTETVLGKR